MGTFFRGVEAGRMHELTLEEGGAFVLRVLHAGSKIGELSGFYTHSARTLTLTPDAAAAQTDGLSAPPTLDVFEWGPRVYLIEPHRADAFYTAVVDGFEPRRTRAGGVFLRDGDELRDAPPMPRP